MPGDELEVGPMDFGDAMREVVAGGRVRRPDWPVTDYVFLAEWLKLRKEDGPHTWMVHDSDMTAMDWVTF